MKLGTKVRKVVPDIEGTVVGARWSEADAALQVCVACTIGGAAHERWFAADELEIVADAPAPAADAPQEG